MNKIYKKIIISILMFLFVGCNGNISSSRNFNSSNLSNSTLSSSNFGSIDDSKTSNSSNIVLPEPSNPTLTVVEDFKININEHVNYLNLVNATDTIDGNITHLVKLELPDNVTEENGDLYFANPGEYTIKFSVTNSFGLSSYEEIKIIVYEILDEDTVAPVILNYKNIRVKENVMAYPLDGVIAKDDVDGDLTSKLVATYLNDVDASQGISFKEEGMYSIDITVTDNVGNKTKVTIQIEVNNEDLPTYVDITDYLTKEYNSTVEESNEVPFKGANSKKVSLKFEEGVKKYANFKILFPTTENLEGKKITFYTKIGDNVNGNKLSFDLRTGDVGVGQKEISIESCDEEGFGIINKGNGWYQVTLVFAKLWKLTSYQTDYIRIVFSNIDYSKTAIVYIANILLDDYKEGEIIGEESNSDSGGESGTITPTPTTSDLSDDLEVNYNCEIEFDTQISHDGTKSAKISATGSWFATKIYPQKDLKDHYISFFVKFNEDSIGKNAVYLEFEDPSGVKISSDLTIMMSSLPNGVTMEDTNQDGWYKITVNCNSIGIGGTTTRKLVIKASCADTVALDGVMWVDVLNIYKSEDEDTSNPGDNIGGDEVVESIDLTSGLYVDYNCILEDSIDKPTSQSIAKHSQTVVDSDATDKIYSGIRTAFSNTLNLSNAKLSFYAKLGNVYKNRLSLTLYKDDGTKIGGSDVNIIVGDNSSFYSSTLIDNGWYLIEIDISLGWANVDSYLASKIRITYCNTAEDLTIPADLYIADLQLFLNKNN